jgi:transposase
MGREPTIRYSEAFKAQVVNELTTGRFASANEARLRYGIGGCETVLRWVRQRGRHDLIGKLVKVETVDERDQLRTLKAELKQVRAVLAQTQVESVMNRAFFEVLCEQFGVTDVEAVKKKAVTRLSSEGR